MKIEKDFYHVSLKIFLRDKSGRILALKAVENGSMAGYYDLPGGRIDNNEFKVPFREIIKRELLEEVGGIRYKLNNNPVAIGRHLIPENNIWHKYKKDIHIMYVFFEASYLSGTIKISKEHTDYEWLDLKNIKLENYFTSGILEGIKMYRSNK